MSSKWGSGSLSSFGRKGDLVVPSDTTDLATEPKAVTVTAAGTLAVIPQSNEDADVIEYEEVPVGFTPPYVVRRVMSTGTTATVWTVDD